jgi:NAD(P)-dependent dehydrogenase (short-subunit alcohol dehydrogenase family)
VPEYFFSGESKLDILIHNAAVCCIPYAKTEDGYETTMMVNYLGPFLLTYQLIDLLIASGPSRIINVSSHIHVFARMNFADLMMEHHYTPFKAYCRSKLAQIMHTTQLAKQLQG